MPLHPQAQSFLDGLAAQNAPGWEELSPVEGREIFSSLGELFGNAPTVGSVEDRNIGESLNVRIFSPEGDGPFPVVVYFHGGGWVLGNLDTHDALCRRLANASETIVVAVDYRRSPEAIFPAALEDCYQATQFVVQQSESLNIDPTRVIVAGDSAGANLAAAVALLSRDRGGPEISLQLLIYPVLDQRCGSESYAAFAEGHGLTKSAMQWFWRQYLGNEDLPIRPLASPLLADDLTDLPVAHVITAEYDVLSDEGEAYVEKLLAAGVPVTHRRYEGMIHGFVHLAGIFDAGQQAGNDIAEVIRNTVMNIASLQE